MRARQTWDAAIRAVQQNMLELAREVPLSDEQDRILTAAFLRCEELTAKKCLTLAATNAELAEKYSVSPRTVRNWRREGCPFARGQWRVMDWLARRRYAPAGTEAKFAKQLKEQRRKASWTDLNAIIYHARELKALHLHHELNWNPTVGFGTCAALGADFISNGGEADLSNHERIAKYP